MSASDSADGESLTQQFDTGRWVAYMVEHTALNEREAQVTIRARQGMTLGTIARKLGMPAGDVQAYHQTALDKLSRAFRTYMCLFAPPWVHEELGEYPRLKAQVREALDPDHERNHLG